MSTRARLLLIVAVGVNLLCFALAQYGNRDLLRGDFKMFYTAAVALRSGHKADLYSPELHRSMQSALLPALPVADVKVFTHPPYELLVFLPLSFLPYQKAIYLWAAITLLFALVSGRLLGNYWCWLAIRPDRHLWAGLTLGLGLFRFPIVIPLALLVVVWKPSVIRGLLISGTTILLLSVYMVHFAGMTAYFDDLIRMSRASASAISQTYQIDPRTMPTIRELTFSISPKISKVAAIIDLTLLALSVRFMRSALNPEPKFALAVIVAILISPHSLIDDLALIAIPFVLLIETGHYRAGLALVPFYRAPLCILFYPHRQALLALPLASSAVLIAVANARPMLNILGCMPA